MTTTYLLNYLLIFKNEKLYEFLNFSYSISQLKLSHIFLAFF